MLHPKRGQREIQGNPDFWQKHFFIFKNLTRVESIEELDKHPRLVVTSCGLDKIIGTDVGNFQTSFDGAYF